MKKAHLPTFRRISNTDRVRFTFCCQGKLRSQELTVAEFAQVSSNVIDSTQSFMPIARNRKP